MNIVFFGSFQHYSTLVLESLISASDINVSAVVTTPPMPAGRKRELQKTHTHAWAENHHLPVFTPHTLDNSSLKTLDTESPLLATDYFVVAGYGKILPPEWLACPSLAPLNLHFSLLPAYRGANPAEWALLCNERLTGITLMVMNQGLDTGDIIMQKELAITPDDTRETLYQKLYHLGADVLPEQLVKYHAWIQKKDANCQVSLAPKPQPIKSPTPYARLLKRADGFIPWRALTKAMAGEPIKRFDLNTTLFNQVINHIEKHLGHPCIQNDYLKLIERASRALSGFPGLWTDAPTTKGKKRLKIHSCHINANKHLVFDRVQLEGQQTSNFNQINNQLI
jgi:methionyl-tRNA formyltransferase